MEIDSFGYLIIRFMFLLFYPFTIGGIVWFIVTQMYGTTKQ